jgi:peptidoglycan/LPS O-acetylase OafA/YrhL
LSSIPEKQSFRPDIEGLRAVAVLAVVTNHVAPSYLRGGFTGVDVFFVISGYLIGMHLLEDISAGQFSFLNFYARRARRLLPALVVALTAVWAFGWIILSPPELASLGRHVAAATLFSNNVLLWSESGYFDTPSAAKPLLHLWSLGVEEQFYLLVPVLLWLSSRARHASIAWVARLSVLSFLVTELSVTPSFYLPSTRFWELGVGVAIGYLAINSARVVQGAAVLTRNTYREIIGWALALIFAGALLLESQARQAAVESWLPVCALVAVGVLCILAVQTCGIYRDGARWGRVCGRVSRHDAVLRNSLSLVGLAMIGVSFVFVTPAGWPGAHTTLPVLGTATVILAGLQARGNTFLANAPLPFVGSISYPLYLWHWPLIVYWRMVPVPGISGELIPVGLALLLAWATKELVEGPARFGRLFSVVVPRPRLGVVCAGLLVTAALGIAGIAAGGYPSRFPPRLSAIAAWSIPSADAAWRSHRCYLYPAKTEEFAAECTPAVRSGVPRLLLWGDSHAAHLYPGLVELRKQSAFDVVQWTAAGCPPTLVRWSVEESGCQERREWIRAHMRAAAPDIVVLAARWEVYLSGGAGQEEVVRAVDDDIEWLRSAGVRRIVVFGPGPAWNASLPMDMFRYMSLRHTDRIPERLGAVSKAVWQLDEMLAAQAATYQVQYMSVLHWFCDPSGCRTLGRESERHPDLLFRDQDHLTPSGSRDLMSAAAPKVFGRPPQT